MFTSNKASMLKDVNLLLKDYKIGFSMLKGKYSSYKITVLVLDKEHKDDIFNKLKNLNSVKMVL